MKSGFNKMGPKSILGKYLSKQILLSFLGVLLMVMGIVMLFEVVELLRRTSGRDDVGFAFVMQMALMKLPKTIEMVFPFVMMIAAMITFWKVSKTNEFVIIRAAGVSIWGFLLSVLIVTFCIGLVNITIINPISAKMNEIYETMDYRFKTRNPKAVLFSEKGLWLREAIDENSFMILQAKSVRQEKNELLLHAVTILEMGRNASLNKSLEAYGATLKGNEFSLADVKVYEAGKPVATLNNVKYKTEITIDRIKENFIPPEAISFWNLPDTIKFYEKSGFSAQKHRLRYLSLLASPFLLCAMVLVAAVFALRPNNRRGGVMYLIVGGISTGFIVYFLSQLVYAFGVNGDIPAILAVWTPALIVAMVSVAMLLHLEDG